MAPTCNFDASTYFTAPSPFYSIDFTSTTSASATDLHVNAAGTAAALNGIAVSINFAEVPEPGSLLLLGSGLLGFAGFRRRRARS